MEKILFAFTMALILSNSAMAGDTDFVISCSQQAQKLGVPSGAWDGTLCAGDKRIDIR